MTFIPYAFLVVSIYERTDDHFDVISLALDGHEEPRVTLANKHKDVAF
jgi:hypothetical protein